MFYNIDTRSKLTTTTWSEAENNFWVIFKLIFYKKNKHKFTFKKPLRNFVNVFNKFIKFCM